MIPKCANCGIPIRWLPTRVDGALYCCVGCSAGGPCECDYAHLPRPEVVAPLARRIRRRSPELARDRVKRVSHAGVKAV